MTAHHSSSPVSSEYQTTSTYQGAECFPGEEGKVTWPHLRLNPIEAAHLGGWCSAKSGRDAHITEAELPDRDNQLRDWQLEEVLPSASCAHDDSRAVPSSSYVSDNELPGPSVDSHTISSACSNMDERIPSSSSLEKPCSRGAEGGPSHLALEGGSAEVLSRLTGPDSSRQDKESCLQAEVSGNGRSEAEGLLSSRLEAGVVDDCRIGADFTSSLGGEAMVQPPQEIDVGECKSTRGMGSGAGLNGEVTGADTATTLTIPSVRELQVSLLEATPSTATAIQDSWASDLEEITGSKPQSAMDHNQVEDRPRPMSKSADPDPLEQLIAQVQKTALKKQRRPRGLRRQVSWADDKGGLLAIDEAGAPFQTAAEREGVASSAETKWARRSVMRKFEKRGRRQAQTQARAEAVLAQALERKAMVSGVREIRSFESVKRGLAALGSARPLEKSQGGGQERLARPGQSAWQYAPSERQGGSSPRSPQAVAAATQGSSEVKAVSSPAAPVPYTGRGQPAALWLRTVESRLVHTAGQ